MLVIIKQFLLGLFGTVWGVVVIISAIRTGEVPAELWAVLGIGVGGLLAAFNADSRTARRPRRSDKNGDDPEDTGTHELRG